MTNEELKEKLAEHAHEVWSEWMKYMFGKMELISHRTTTDFQYWVQLEMPLALKERWDRQMNTPYAELPESEKESARERVEKILKIIEIDHDDIQDQG